MQVRGGVPVRKDRNASPFRHCEAPSPVIARPVRTLAVAIRNPRPLVLICRNGSHVRKRPCSQIPTKRPLQIAPAALGCDLVFFSLVPSSPGGRIQWGEPAVPPLAVRRGPGNLYGMVPRRFLSPISFPPKEMGSPAGEMPPSCSRPARRRRVSGLLRIRRRRLLVDPLSRRLRRAPFFACPKKGAKERPQRKPASSLGRMARKSAHGLVRRFSRLLLLKSKRSLRFE